MNAAAVRPLRHAVLRPEQPLDASVYEGDDAQDSAHFGCLCRGILVGVASVTHQAPPGATAQRAWCLRGVGTLAAVRGRGYGTALVAAAQEHVAMRGGGLLWCNARRDVVGFYCALGFTDAGEPSVAAWRDTHRLMHRLVEADAGRGCAAERPPTRAAARRPRSPRHRAAAAARA
jgi:L-Ala-D/L-Glu epimerase